MLALAVFATLAGSAAAGMGPENVAVVVNGDSEDSLTVASAYEHLRGIPDSNFIVLHHITGTETTNVDLFRKEILQPVLNAIRDRGLTAQIDCISYSVDIPYAVDVTGDVKGRKLPLVITQTASTNGLTYLSDWVLKGDINYLGLDVNRYARHQLPMATGAELSEADQTIYADVLDKYEKKDYANAAKILAHLLETPRDDSLLTYNLACIQALAGQPDDAIASLHKAVANGYRNYSQAAAEPDFASLKNNDEFNQILRVLKSATIEVQPGVPFQRATGWGRTGEPDAGGDHYMLSTMLGVTAGRGNSVDEILACLKRDAAADFSAPKGTIYFERNGDVRSTTREWGFQAAAEELRRLGVNAVVEDGVLPQNRADVAGAMIGISDFDWTASKSTILPGAICEHFTSFGGVMAKGAGQTPCSVFIRAGAGGTSGVVTEPYALQDKFPTPFMHVEYAKGFTLAESFYQSLYGPYQLMVIGDPLCRPWAKEITVTVPQLKPDSRLNGTLRLVPSVTPAAPVSRYELLVDGKVVKSAKSGVPLVLDSHSYDEGFHTVSVVAILANQPESEYRKTVEMIFGMRARNEASAGGGGDTAGQIVHLAAPGAVRIEVFRLGESYRSKAGDSVDFDITARTIGRGTQTFYPVATYEVGGKSIRVHLRPFDVGMRPPTAQ
jgi:hypothetical protein